MIALMKRYSAGLRLFLGLLIAVGALYALTGHSSNACATSGGTGTGTGTTGGTGTGTTGAASGGCGWEAFMNAVGHRESTNQPQRRNSLGYSGLFQFGEAALKQIGWYCSAPVGSQSYQAFSGRWCPKAQQHGVHTIQDFLQKPEAQKIAFLEWMKYIYTATKQCHNKINTQTAGGRSCTVTQSGILGGGHIGGATGVCNTLLGRGNVSDSYGTSRLDYVCCFKGYAVCDTVAPGDSSCNNGTSDGTCGDSGQRNCQGGTSSGSGGGTSTGAGSQAPEYQVGAPISGLDIPWGPSPHIMALLSDTLKMVWVASLQIMTSQLTTTMVQHTQAIGMLLDAKHQMEIQRLMQQKQAEAHKDYHPSVQMCEVGTMVRNLANTDKHRELTHQTIVRRILKRELAAGEATTAEGETSDLRSRLKHLRDVYCNVEDNGKMADNLCNNKDADPKRANRDVDYTTTLENPLSLKLDFNDKQMSEDEENVMALMNNLFYHRAFPNVPESYTTLKRMTAPMQDMRSVIAMRGVARHSIGAIVSMKTEGPEHENNAAPYMRAFIKDFGLELEEMNKMFGENPSYYAQMEIMTKKLYQHPNFIVNLYDKPANVKRIRTTMQAIKSMQDRDIHEAMMRREMLLSMILELRIRQNQAEVLNNIQRNMYRATPSGSATGGGSGSGSGAGTGTGQ